MSILSIFSMASLDLYNEDFMLRKKSRNLETLELSTEWFKKLVNDMFETLYHDPSGVGLAAPQIGMALKIVVIDIKRDAKNPIILVNPTYTALEEELVTSHETCLSVPFYSGEVERFKKVKVNALGFKGEPIELIGEKFLSFVFQHEIDHLNGMLYIDKIENKSKISPYVGYSGSLAQKAISSLETEKA